MTTWGGSAQPDAGTGLMGSYVTISGVPGPRVLAEDPRPSRTEEQDASWAHGHGCGPSPAPGHRSQTPAEAAPSLQIAQNLREARLSPQLQTRAPARPLSLTSTPPPGVLLQTQGTPYPAVPPQTRSIPAPSLHPVRPHHCPGHQDWGPGASQEGQPGAAANRPRPRQHPGAIQPPSEAVRHGPLAAPPGHPHL